MNVIVRTVLLLAFCLAMLTACRANSRTEPPEAAPEAVIEESPKETLVFADLNWDSAIIQNRIVQYLVEKGYGYPTDVVPGTTLPLFQELLDGTIHISMEIWLPNQLERWNNAVAMEQLVALGESLTGEWQSAFVIPAYLQEQYPELDSVEDLKEAKFRTLFESHETDGRARLVSCVIGWTCEVINELQVTGYGLSDHIFIVTPPDAASSTASLYRAYEQGEPWLGYQWGTNTPALLLDLVRLEEPPYSEQCWTTTKACGYSTPSIMVTVHPSVSARAPEVVEMLTQYGITVDEYSEIVRHRVNEELTPPEAVQWWLLNYPDVWEPWVTEEAANGIWAALEAGETADGWPEETTEESALMGRLASSPAVTRG